MALMKTWTTKSGCTLTRILHNRCNVYLLSNGTASILIDTNRKRWRRKLFAALDSLGITRLDALVLTHTHFDHAENAAAVKAKYGAKVIVHASEAALLRKGNSPLPKGAILPTRILMALLAEKIQHFFAHEPCEPDILVEDHYPLSAFGFNAYLLPTPGHSRGSVSIIIDDELAVTGDAVYGIVPGAVFPPFADDPAQLVESWGTLLKTGSRLFLPGHGRPVPRDLLEKRSQSR